MPCFSLVLASSLDFDEGIQVVSFSSRQTKAVAYIHIKNDDIVENTEKFKVEILIAQDEYNSGVRFGRQPTATVYIKNGELLTEDVRGHIQFASFKLH